MPFAYVGSFTTPQRRGHGGGINVYRIHPDSGAWTHEQLLEAVNPAFLVLDHTQCFLYSVHADLDEVSAYVIDQKNGHITALNKQSCGGINPVHIAIDPTGRWIITANYGAGSIGVLPISRDGTLGPRTCVVDLCGEPGSDGHEQARSHPHHVVFDPSGRFMAVPDKGLDRIFVFHLDTVAGILTPNDPAFVATRAGAGPRHLAFHCTLPMAYVINELASTVTTYRFDKDLSSLNPIQVVPSIPPSHTGHNSGAAISVASSGHHLYVSNRGHDSIATFDIDQQSGELTSVAWTLTGAKSPRFFDIDPAGKILYAAHADEGMGGCEHHTTNLISAFKVNDDTGFLTPFGPGIRANSPCTIVFTCTIVSSTSMPF